MTYDRENLHRVHLFLVEEVNNAKDKLKHDMAVNWLFGFRRALDALGVLGQEIIACDMYYLDRGIDRPMIGGEFLDWTPTEHEERKE